MKCGLHSRKTIFEHPPLSEQENSQCFHVRFPLPASITRKVHIYIYIYMSSSCLCMFMPRSTHSERCPTILVAEENRWWLDHAASIVRFWKAIINKRSQYVDGTSLGVHICQTIAGYQHETPSGTQIAGADSKSRPSTASGATIWLRSGSQYRWLEGFSIQTHPTCINIPYPLSMINSSSCINFLWSDWIFLGMSSMKPSRLGSPCYRDS